MRTPGSYGPEVGGPGLKHLGLRSRDFDQIAGALHLLQVELRQLSCGPSQGEVELVTVGPFHLLRTAVNRIVLARGAARADTYLVSLVGGLNEQAVWRGQRRRRGDLNLNRPESEIDHLTGQPYESLTIGINVGRLQSAGMAYAGYDVAERLGGVERVRVNENTFAALEVAVKRVFASARSPAELPESPLDRAELEESLTRTLLDALEGESALVEKRSLRDRRRLVERAEEFMLAGLSKPLLLGDLCEELGVSERTLRYAFHDRFGVSPLAYFKRQKLNSIRQQIRGSRPGSVGIQQIARDWGLVHMGNFAADYNRLFGELPSETGRQSRPR
jgi:AraC family ethanolamine operon transcriptional activator